MVNKSTTVNRFVLHTLHRNITHLAIIIRKTNIKLGILKGHGEQIPWGGGGGGGGRKKNRIWLPTPRRMLKSRAGSSF